MNHHRRPGLRATGIAVATTASLAIAGLAGTSYASGGGTAPSASTVRAPRAATGSRPDPGFVDVAEKSEQRDAAQARTRSAAPGVRSKAVPATPKPDATGLVLDISGATGTVRWTANVNGFLTPASTLSPRRIAFDYVEAHPELGLSSADLTTLHLHRDYKDITGTHHLYFQQRINGSVVARNGLTASVNKAGHLLTLGGAPLSSASRTAAPTTLQPTITTPAEALAQTRGAVAAGADTSQDTATRVVFATGTALRPAWETVVMSTAQPASTIIDAVTGEVLLRRPLTNYEHSTGRVFTYFPGAKRGGRQVKMDFTKRHWLKANAHKLSGNNSHTFSDLNDNNHASKKEEVHPKKGAAFSYKLQPFHPGLGAQKFCSNPWPCSWDPNKRFSWRVNRAQNATQVFFFVNKWHDHLKAAPIGFTEAAGNFQLKNHSQKGKGGDPVDTQTDDGANTNRGLPDDFHIDNANMSTPPDGHRPTMQMFLQHTPFSRYPGQDPFSPTNVGDEADTVYHEYTHGLSNRLNVDVQGHSTLGGVQAGAMGEAWSDWYAMDYLVDKHLAKDGRKKADVRLFPYDGVGVKFDRTEPIDCKVGQKAKLCNGGGTGHRGGYTYKDYGQVIGFPEVHGDGEIWAQTLWSLRARLGSGKTESLVTRAMELAPYNPSFVDMRNAILVADQSRNGGADANAIWKVFASRGMGFSASSDGGGDTSPVAAFNQPPF